MSDYASFFASINLDLLLDELLREKTLIFANNDT